MPKGTKRISNGVKKINYGKKVVDLTFAKSEDYKNVLKEIKRTAKCPFCKENFKYHRKPILKSEKGWFLTESSWPYKNTLYHFVIISQKHKENFSQLNSSDFKSVSKLVNWTVKRYRIKGGGLALRFGKTNYSGSTVCHLHFHLIVPQIDKKTKKSKTVYFPLG